MDKPLCLFPKQWRHTLRMVFRVFLAILLCSSAACNRPADTRLIAEIEDLNNTAAALHRSNPDSAMILHRIALDKARRTNDPGIEASVWRLMGICHSIRLELNESDSCNFETIRLASLSNDPLTVSNTYINLGINQSRRGNEDSALVLYRKAHVMMAGHPDQRKIEKRTFNNMGLSFYGKAQLDSAVVYLTRAFRIAEQDGEANSMAKACQNMGNCYQRMEDLANADRYFRMADSLYASVGNRIDRMNVKSNRVTTLARMGRFNEALATADEAEAIAREANMTKALGALYNNRGLVFYLQKDYRRSFESQLRSMELKKQTGDTVGLIASYNSMIALCMETKELSKAEAYGLQGLALAEKRALFKDRLDLYNNLAEVYGLSGNYRKAAELLKKREALKDSVFSADKYQVIEELRTRYETEKKDRAIQLATLNLDMQKKTSLWLAFSCLLLIVLLSSVYVMQRKKLQAHKQLAEQGKKVAELTAKTLIPNCGNDYDNNENGLSEEKSNALLRELLHCMEEKKMYKNPSLTLDMLAETIGTNRSYLSVLINSRMKKGFVEYVNFYRVEEAKRLLRTGNDKIAHVCAEAGFGSTQTFYTAFKNFEHLTPSEYRKACGKEISIPLSSV